MPKPGRAAAVREKRFIAHYAVHFNGAAAVRYAGYEGPPKQYARELLAKPHIQKAVNKAVGELGDLHFRLNDELIGRAKAMLDALEDPTRIFDADGAVLPVKDWPEDLRCCIRGFDVEESTTTVDESVMSTTRIKKVRFESPVSVLATLGKFSGAAIDRTQFLDRHGNPTDPPAAATAPVIHVTVGGVSVDPAAAAPQTPAEKKKSARA
jgi:hypothetical protein